MASVAGLLWVADAPARGATPADQRAQLALEAIADGNLAERDQLLADAIKLSPENRLARTLRGEIKGKHGWMPLDSVDQEPLSAEMSEYLQLRSATLDNDTEHFRLAEWCAQHQLPDQARAHYNRVLELNPNHTAARKRLQYALIEGVWYSHEDAQEARSFLTKLQRASTRWGATVAGIEACYREYELNNVERARRALANVSDPYAMVLCENRLTTIGPVPAEHLVLRTSQFNDQVATTVLCRLATYSQWPSVQTAAIAKLRERNEDGVYPVLLGALHSPAQVLERDLFRNAAGYPVVHLVLFREEINQLQRGTVNVVVDTKSATYYGGRHKTFGVVPAATKVAWAAHLADQAVAARNESIEQANEPIYRVLRELSGETGFDQPTAWWNWWEARNEHYTVNKALVTGTIVKKFSLPPYLLVSTCSCFAAGTPVMTSTGLRPIDSIQIGDLVLSQDPVSGAVEFKPVLRTTVRNDAEIIRVRIGDELLHSSGGHRFWVVDKGWVRARALTAGNRLSALSQALTVDEAETTGENATVYNLVVDGYHTYFVGRSHVLTHDVTPAKPALQGLPGAIARKIVAR